MAPRVSRPVLLVLGACLFAAPLPAQAPPTDPIPSRTRTFRIPFDVEAPARRIRQVHLWVSDDQGRTWRHYGSVPADRGYFEFQADRDGLYAFATQTVDADNRAYPADMRGAQPGLRVLVDTQPPSVYLKARPAGDGRVGVEWDVRDDNFDAASFHLEYRPPGETQWLPLRVDVSAHGQHTWDPGAVGVIDVRLQVADRVGNRNEGRTTVAPGGRGSLDPEPDAPRSPRGPSSPPLRLVNSKRISLNYDISDVGPSGVREIELWFTTDGRSWQMYQKFPREVRPLVFEAKEERRYGFTLVVFSGVGLSERPPQVGDEPQIWVEVDVTRPVVSQLQVEVGRGPDSGKLFVEWTARDKNLGPRPITLAYSEQAEGPWKKIESNLPNTGRFTWQLPGGDTFPWQFFVRVEAADLAGNVGFAQTRELVKVDLKRPRGVILDVEGAGAAVSPGNVPPADPP